MLYNVYGPCGKIKECKALWIESNLGVFCVEKNVGGFGGG